MICFAHVVFIFIVLQFLCIKQLFAIPVKNENDDIPKLLIVSFDGFRNEYFDRNLTPYLNSLRKIGTYADYMRNIFPTKTFPNHHTIATGQPASVHGVMANSFYDNQLGLLKYGYELFHFNEELIPIWILNQKTDKKRHSGCMMWPGSDFTYKGEACKFTGKYNKTASWEDRVDTIIKWFKDDQTPINLAMLYIEEPDKHAHGYGPDSEVIENLVRGLDKLSEYIRIKLRENKLDVNIIQLSDHGMEGVSSQNFIDLKKLLKNDTYEMYGTSPVLQVVPKKGYENNVYNLLREASIESKKFNVYLNENLPERWNYRNDRRSGPITVVAELGYAFQDMWEAALFYEGFYNISISPSHKYGIHGYDNNISTMHPFFIATGPAIKENHKVLPFDTLDLYDLFSKILDITPQNNSGNINNILDILKFSTNNDKDYRISQQMIITST